MESENKENNPKIRYYKSQRYGWVEIHEGDRDWKFGVSYDDFMNELVEQDAIRNLLMAQKLRKSLYNKGLRTKCK